MRLSMLPDTVYSSACLPCTRLPAAGRLLTAFLISFLLAFQYCRTAFNRDPGSFFFDPNEGYARAYSLDRQFQADDYITYANDSAIRHNGNGASADKTMCVGVATVQRPQNRYFRSTVGSILEGLTDAERRSIDLILFIAHTDPTVHAAYGEDWLPAVADRVLLYDLNQTEMAYVRTLEEERDFRVKGLYDYVYLLKACYESGAPWVTMIEDDTIAIDGWYPRTMAALDRIEEQSHRGNVWDWLYLRLFYTEEFLGWNREEWPRYLIQSLGWVLAPTAALLLVRHSFPKLRRVLTIDVLAVLCGICIPSFLVLYFLCGRVSMQPLAPGVQEMSRFGCCSQGFVFPRHVVPRIIDHFERKKVGFVDMLLEEWADTDHLLRWAVVPSVLQHVGRKSSKGDDYGENSRFHMSVAEKLWNFAFELNDASQLRDQDGRLRFPQA
ncbi:MAG: hypothetical protein M1838_003312 [Thelocarpon superellum]|nr:MAG: hypothetical protein M1838_003312 [Thelocarpon superellum]